MKISVLGTGYVGLVAGSCFSDSGNHVTCIDVDKDKVSRLNRGEIPIYEPGLDEIVERNVRAKRLAFTSDTAEAISKSEVVFVAVGTPLGEDGSLDLKYVWEAVRMIKEAARGDLVVVMKSTVPVGTADGVRERLKGCPHFVEVVSNPEFLKEGTAINDFLKPERVVVGCQSERARRLMGELYAPYVRSGNPIYYMDNRSAELAKYAANTFLAMKISFINELAVLCETVGANIHQVRKAIISDSRIGSKFLYAGCGYGGSCFPKDVLALIQLGKENGMALDMFRSVHAVNERQKRLLFSKMNKHFKGELKGKKVAVWGLSFKPETDDMREAPSVALIHDLLKAGAEVWAYDPVAREEAKRLFENKVHLVEEPYEAIPGAQALSILTEWNEFRNPDFLRLKKELSSPVIFDGRNLYEAETLESRGFTYFCIGRPDPK